MQRKPIESKLFFYDKEDWKVSLRPKISSKKGDTYLKTWLKGKASSFVYSNLNLMIHLICITNLHNYVN